MTPATSQPPNNIRKKVGPAVWLLSVCVHGAPTEWSGDEPAWIAGGKPITAAQLAEWLGESTRTIATWRLTHTSSTAKRIFRRSCDARGGLR
jgi:hypothetical protein